MDISISNSEDRTTISLMGRLTFKENQVFNKLLADLFADDQQHSTCVFDLQKVDFIDSAGIGMLLIAKDKASQKNVEIILANAPDAARRIIHIARLDRIFTIE